MLVHAVEVLKAKWGARQSSNKQPVTPSRESKMQQLKAFASRTSPLNPFVRRGQPYRRGTKKEANPDLSPSPVPERSRLSFNDFPAATSGDYWPDLKWSEHPITGGLPRSQTTSDITLLATRTADWRGSPPPLRHHRAGSLVNFPYANDFGTQSITHLPIPSAPSPHLIQPASKSTSTDIRPSRLLNHSPPPPRRRAKSPMPLRSYTQPNLLSTIQETQKANHFSVPHRTVFREEFNVSPSPARRFRHYQMYPPPPPAAPRAVTAPAAVPTHQRRRLSSRRRPNPKLTPISELFPDHNITDGDSVGNENEALDGQDVVGASTTATPTPLSVSWPRNNDRRRDSAALDQDDDGDSHGAWPDPVPQFNPQWKGVIPNSSADLDRFNYQPLKQQQPYKRPLSAPLNERQNLSPCLPAGMQQERVSNDSTIRTARTARAAPRPKLTIIPAAAPSPTQAAFHLPARACLSSDGVCPPYGTVRTGSEYAAAAAATSAAVPIGIAI